MNPILATDSYKASHFRQYPPGTARVSAYIAPRSAPAVLFGLQAALKTHMRPVTAEHVAEAEALLTAHGLPFNRPGWARIVDVHGGHLPLEISALPEGTPTPAGVPQVQVVNTDPALPWLTTYVETWLLRGVWYPSSVATVSREMKRVLARGLAATGDDPLDFKLHDFGARGATSAESAALGGLAHLVNFQGTDTVEALVAARRFYGAEMAGFSIPAAEHATMTAWGEAGERDAFANMLAQFPEGLVAVVSDSYDVMRAAREVWGGALRQAVLDRPGTVVVRPDSGDPTKVPLDVIEALMDRFGHRVNAKGFRVLPDQVRVIQGDGIDRTVLERIVNAAMARGLSLDNLAFGCGAGLLQRVDRDTFGYAMKASAVEAEGTWHDVWKAAPGKASLRGRQAVVETGQTVRLTPLEAVRLENLDQTTGADLLRPVWRDGALLIDEGLDAIRARAAL